MQNKEQMTIIVAIAIVVLAIVTSFAWYHVNDRALMSKNISEAVAKGMDPLSVRCTYAHSGDTICIAYAASTNRK